MQNDGQSMPFVNAGLSDFGDFGHDVSESPVEFPDVRTQVHDTDDVSQPDVAQLSVEGTSAPQSHNNEPPKGQTDAEDANAAAPVGPKDERQWNEVDHPVDEGMSDIVPGSLISARFVVEKSLGADSSGGLIFQVTDSQRSQPCRSCGEQDDDYHGRTCTFCGVPLPLVTMRASTTRAGDADIVYGVWYCSVVSEQESFSEFGASIDAGGWSAEGPHVPNEDSYWFTNAKSSVNSTRRSVAAILLADGMGGYAPGSGLISGQIADLTGHEILAQLERTSSQFNASVDLEQIVRNAIGATNQVVLDAAARVGEMGSTVIVVVILDGVAYVANIGDSRLYHISALGAVTQVTEDQSLLAQQVRSGAMSEDDMYTAPGSNIILHAVGEPGVEADADWYIWPLGPGDRLILCSDGFWKATRGQLPDYVTTFDGSLDSLAHKMVHDALAAGSDDNTTVVIVRAT